MTLITTSVATALNPALAQKLNSPKQNTKGSLGNRVEYSTKQAGNLIKTDIKARLATSTGIGATFLAAYGTLKSKGAQDIISKSMKSLANKFNLKEIAQELTPILKEAAGKIKSLPAPVKAVAAVGLLLTSAIGSQIRTQGVYEAGKIDQEYTDKAKLQNIIM